MHIMGGAARKPLPPTLLRLRKILFDTADFPSSVSIDANARA
jgi:hypothetical protein